MISQHEIIHTRPCMGSPPHRVPGIHRGIPLLPPRNLLAGSFGSFGCLVPSSPRKELARTRATALANVAFSGAMLAVMPVYGLMAFAPRSKITSVTLKSRLFFSTLGVVYVALLFWGGVDWSRANALMGLYNGSTAALHRSIAEIARSTIETAGPNAMSVHVRIPELAQQFLQPGFTATVWLHFMLLDLVLARQLFFDSLSRAVPFAHTAMLCFMCGPIGVLSHLVTRALSHMAATASAADQRRPPEVSRGAPTTPPFDDHGAPDGPAHASLGPRPLSDGATIGTGAATGGPGGLRGPSLAAMERARAIGLAAEEIVARCASAMTTEHDEPPSLADVAGLVRRTDAADSEEAVALAEEVKERALAIATSTESVAGIMTVAQRVSREAGALVARLEAAGMEQGAEAMRCAELSCERWEKTLRRMRDDLNATAGADGSFASDVAQLRQKMDRLEAIVAPGRVPSAASSDAALSLGTMEHPQQRDSTARSAVTAAREMLEDARRTLEEDGSCHSLGIRSGKGSGAGVGPDGAERGDVKTKAGHAGSDADRDSREERAGTKGLDEDETGSRGVAGDTAASPRRGEGLVVLAVGHRRALSPSDRVGRDMGRRGGHVGVFAMKGSRVDGEEGAERGVKGADGREEEDTGRGDGGETRVVEVEDGTQEREGGEQSPSAGTEREARTGEEARGTVRDLLEMEGSTGEKAATVVVEGMMGGSADVARLVLVGGGLFLAGVVVGAMLLGSVVWDGESLGHGVGHEEAASVGSLNNS